MPFLVPTRPQTVSFQSNAFVFQILLTGCPKFPQKMDIKQDTIHGKQKIKFFKHWHLIQ